MIGNDYALGIVGFGGMGNWHRELIATIDGLTVAGIWDVKESRRQYARENNVFVYDGLEAMLGDERVDVVLVSTPNDLHKEIACKALRAGKHVVSEKPVALSGAELSEMQAAAKASGKLLTVHQNRRWDEDFLTMKAIYDQKLLGDVFRIESRVHGSHGIPGDWRQEKEHGGGMMLDWGVHIIDQMLRMVDEKVKKVYCRCDHVTNEVVDDGFALTLTFESGKTAYLEVGTSNFINLPRWYMLGQNGTAVIHDWDLSGKIVRAKTRDERDVVPVKTAAGLTKTMAPRRGDTIFEEPLPVVHSDIRDFYRNVMDAVAGKAKPYVQIDEVMRVMKLMEAAFASDRLNQSVDFE